MTRINIIKFYYIKYSVYDKLHVVEKQQLLW